MSVKSTRMNMPSSTSVQANINNLPLGGSGDVLTVDQLVGQDEWVCDSERYRCHVCTRNFNSFRRKHHCRRCGEVVCRNCTLYKEAELPVLGRSRVRVCMSCILNHSSVTTQSSSLSSTGKILSAVALPEDDEEPSKPNNSLPPGSSGLPLKRIPPKQISVDEKLADDVWNLDSPAGGSNDVETFSDLNALGNHYDYPLMFDWEHPWPRPPIPPDEAQRLEALQSFDVLDTPPEDVFNLVCELASNALKCPIAAVSFVDSDRQWFKASVGLAQTEIPRNVSLCAHTIMSSEPVVVLDTLKDRRFQNNPIVTGAANIRFYAAAPICTPAGYVIGTVFVFDNRPRQKCDYATLEKLANVAMKNLEDRKNSIARPVQRPGFTTQAASLPSSTSGNATSSAVTNPAPNNGLQQRAVQPQGQMVQSGAYGQPPAPAPSSALVPGSNMEAMLMDLLCRTTETQQQLATQQNAMFQSIGHHSAQIDKLTDTVSRLEAKLDAHEKLMFGN